MPLKHFTETLLVVILGAAILLTGLLLATLPPLPAGLFPAVILLAVTLLYPLALHPLFRNNRADNPFRLLHLFPALMVGLWLLLGVLSLWLPSLSFLHRLYAWGWTLSAVLLGFFLLMLFCINVLRRWLTRFALLSLLLVPFTALAIASGTVFHWDRALAAQLWQGTWWDITGSGSSLIAQLDTNLTSSSNSSEEEWRRKLREFQQAQTSSRSSVAAPPASSLPAIIINNNLPPAPIGSSSPASSVSSAPTITQASSSVPALVPPPFTGTPPPPPPITPQPVPPPPNLAHAGFGTEALLFLFLAGYAAVVHKRLIARTVRIEA